MRISSTRILAIYRKIQKNSFPYSIELVIKAEKNHYILLEQKKAKIEKQKSK